MIMVAFVSPYITRNDSSVNARACAKIKNVYKKAGELPDLTATS